MRDFGHRYEVLCTEHQGMLLASSLGVRGLGKVGHQSFEMRSPFGFNVAANSLTGLNQNSPQATELPAAVHFTLCGQAFR